MQVLTHFPILKALGWALFDSLWQMAALWLLYSLLMAVFHAAAARIRHGLALLSIGLGTIWTGITFFAILLFPDSGNDAWLPFLSPGPSAPGWWWHTSRAFMDVALSYGSSLYLLTLAGLLVRCAGHYRQTRQLTRNGRSTMPAEFRVFVTSTAFQLGIRKPVRVWLSSLVDVPLTLGFLKPLILFPIAMMSQLSTKQVEAILIHELGHIRRKDYLLHLVVTILEGLFFFNPFARLLIRQLKKEREHCCDDLVLQFKYDPHAYVSALLSLAAYHQPVRKLAVAATGSSDKLLLERARRILLRQEGNRSRPGMRPLLLVLFTMLMTAAALYRPLATARQRPAPAAAKVSLRAAPPGSFFEVTLNGSIRSVPPSGRIAHARPQAKRRQPVRRQGLSGETFSGETFSGEFLSGRSLSGGSLSGESFGGQPDIAESGDSYVPGDDNVPGNDNVVVSTAENGFGSIDGRDFTLNAPSATSGPSINLQQGTPVVPNNSFSFQYTLGDSSRPEEQLLYLQLSSQREVMAAINKLQEQTATRLKALAALQAKAMESVDLRRRIKAEQNKIQSEYLRKISTWQHKLEKTTHVRVIVYI
jgi:beta-lactamase regulating signal transducer with metallopeptidase domain